METTQNPPQFKNFKQLLNYYEDEKRCIALLEQRRWNGKPECPHCGHSEKIYRTNRGFKCGDKACQKKFSVTVGTIFENSKIKLSLWFAAIYIAANHKKGISSLQLSRDLGITQKTAWFMLHRIREMVRSKSHNVMEGKVQVDESYFGGSNSNRHAHKKVKYSQGRSLKDKTPVFGLLQENGEIKTMVVPDTKARTLKPIINAMVKQGSIVVTDELTSYRGLSQNYSHHIVSHGRKEFARDGFHVNGLEGFWSLFKRGIYGVYHYASPKHLHRYCDEFSYRYNTRKITDQCRFDSSLTLANGRLTYDALVGKE
jgi:transposase-like protein